MSGNDVDVYHGVSTMVGVTPLRYPHIARWYLHMAHATNQQRQRAISTMLVLSCLFHISFPH
jgi:hypothetical protein